MPTDAHNQKHKSRFCSNRFISL